MAKIPDQTITVASLIDKAHENSAEKPRHHMGASQLGHCCDRWLWLSFRWAVIPKFPGRVLRIFRRGHHEENWIVSDLRRIGVNIHSTAGRQSRVDFGCHVRGSIDGIIETGLHEAPNTRHVAEFKTHSKKSFDSVVKDGVEKSKPEHYVQMQAYMQGSGIDRAFYLSVCKDDDRIYTERVRYDKEIADKFIKRGKRLALANRMPEPISTDPSWYQCKFCNAYSFCHETKTTKEVNCRTCAHSTPKENSTWWCERHDGEIPDKYQYEGCGEHVIHPDIVPWKLDTNSSTQEVAVYIIDGKPIRNGAKDKDTYTSREILSNKDAVLSGDDFIAEVREKLNGEIVGDVERLPAKSD